MGPPASNLDALRQPARPGGPGADVRSIAPRRLPPAVLPALGVLAGAALATRLAWLPPWLLAVLSAAGLALGGRAGLGVVAFATGLLAAAVQPAPDLGRLVEVARPVEAVGRVASHGVWNGETWSLSLRSDRIRQGSHVVLTRGTEIRLTLPGSEPPPPFGSQVRLRGYLRRSPGYANALPVEPGPWRMWVKSRRLLAVEAEPGRVAGWAGELRLRVEEALRVAWSDAGHREGRKGAGGRRPDTAPSPDGATRPRAGHALLRALVLGDSSSVPPAWKRGLRRAGLIHVLAVSGLHVGLVVAGVLLVAAPLPVRLRLVPAAAAVGVYLLLVGPRPALLRASLMALLAGAAILARRPPMAGNALAVAAALLVLHRPGLVVDVGFQLTVSATAGLVFLAPRWAGAIQVGAAWTERSVRVLWSGAPWVISPLIAGARLFLAGAAAALTAQVVAAPFSWPVFHLTSLTSPLTNLLAVPWTALFLAVALLWVGWAVAAPAAAGGATATALLDLLAAPFGWPSAGGPDFWGTLPLVAPRPMVWLFLAAVVVPCLVPASAWRDLAHRRILQCGRWRDRGWGCLAAGLLLVVLAAGLALMAAALRWGSPAGAAVPAGVSVTMLDVGQGDAILLRDRRMSVLVDGGGWRRGDFGQRVLLPALLGEGVARLDVVILTHPDRDHCGGLVDVASYLAVGEVWTAPGWEKDPCVGALVAAAGVAPGKGWRRLEAGARRSVGEWSFRVLHPGPAPARLSGSGATPERNDRSLVLTARARGRRVLLTGDVEAGGEGEILRRWRREGSVGAGPGRGTPASLLAADLLKVAHHGSRSSTGRPFLAAVQPRVALVSAGLANPFGHPAPDVVGRLRDAGALVLRTDRLGFVRIEWESADGWRWTVGGRHHGP